MNNHDYIECLEEKHKYAGNKILDLAEKLIVERIANLKKESNRILATTIIVLLALALSFYLSDYTISLCVSFIAMGYLCWVYGADRARSFVIEKLFDHIDDIHNELLQVEKEGKEIQSNYEN